MFIESLEFTIPIDLCGVFSTLQKGPQSNLEFPASVSSYGTTQDASIQVLVKSNKLTFKVDGVSSDSSIISKCESRTLKLAVFDVDRSLIPTESESVQSPVTFSGKRNHDNSISNHTPAKSSRNSDYISSKTLSQNISSNNASFKTSFNSKPAKLLSSNSESSSVRVKEEPEDPDLIEIDPEPDNVEPKSEVPYMQDLYSSTGPSVQTSERVSFPSTSSSFHEKVAHVQDYAEPGPSRQVDQSADDYLVYQDDVDYSDNDNSADYTNEGEKDFMETCSDECSELESKDMKNKNRKTKRCTSWGVKIFKEWLINNGKVTNFECLPRSELNNLLCKFYTAVRTTDGKFYSNSSCIGIRAAIQRYLSELPYNCRFNIILDREFARSNKVFRGVLKKGMTGVKVSTRYEPIIDSDLDKIYSLLDTGWSTGLMKKVWFDISLGFGRSGAEYQRELTRQSFAVNRDDSGYEYICQTDSESDSKLRIYANGAPSCPIVSFKQYISRLNPQNKAFFQCPKKQYLASDNVWYTLVPLGHNTLVDMMRQISNDCQLSRIYTNQCVRATTITRLSDAGISLRGVSKSTACKDVSKYISSDKLKRLCSSILQTPTQSNPKEGTSTSGRQSPHCQAMASAQVNPTTRLSQLQTATPLSPLYQHSKLTSDPGQASKTYKPVILPVVVSKVIDQSDSQQHVSQDCTPITPSQGNQLNVSHPVNPPTDMHKIARTSSPPRPVYQNCPPFRAALGNLPRYIPRQGTMSSYLRAQGHPPTYVATQVRQQNNQLVLFRIDDRNVFLNYQPISALDKTV